MRSSLSLDSKLPLYTRKDASHTKKKMCRNSDCQFSRLKAKKRVRYEPNVTGSPYQDISCLKSNHPTTAYTAQVIRNSTAAVMLRL
jgi:hypothetical protein